MTANEKIVMAAVDAANGKIPTLPNKPGYCLAFVRTVVERALWGGQWTLYDTFLVDGTTKRGDDPAKRLAEAKEDPWAADLERSMKLLGMTVPAMFRKPGDLVFNYRGAAPMGHVAVLLTRDMVIENIHPNFRPHSIHLKPFLSITPYKSLPWTLTARMRATR